MDQPTPRQRITRANFNGEFLIGQFVPSRSDEQFHDGVVSPLIRLKRMYYGFVCTSLVEFRDFSRDLPIWEDSLRRVYKIESEKIYVRKS